MKRILTLITAFCLFFNVSQAQELSIEKQLVGIVGAISGTVKTETRELKAGDKIYLNETIYATEGSGTQILLLDQSTFTIGSDSEVVMDTFIYDPATNDGKIVASVKQGSLKVISGLISKKNPEALTVEVPEGTLGSRGTEFQTIVSNKKTDTLLIGPGKNNTLGLRPGAVLVGNKFGQTMLNKPYSVASMSNGKAPGQAKRITKNQLKKFNKKMRALKVAKLEGKSKEERKEIRKQIRKELKEQGFEKEEIKSLIKENLVKDNEQRIVLLKERGEDTSELEAELADRSIAEETTEPEIAEPEVAEPGIAEPGIIEPKVDEPKEQKADKKKKKKKKLPKNMVREMTKVRDDGTTVTIKQTINRKTGKFTSVQTTTSPDGKVTTKKKKGKFKKKALNKLKKQEKAAINQKPKQPKKKKAKATKEKPKKKKAKATKEKPKKKKAKAKDGKKKPKKKKAKAKEKPKKKKAKAKAKAKPKKKKAKAKAKPKKKKAKAKPKKKKSKAKPKKKKPKKKKAKPKKKKPKKKIKKPKKKKPKIKKKKLVKKKVKKNKKKRKKKKK